MATVGDLFGQQLISPRGSPGRGEFESPESERSEAKQFENAKGAPSVHHRAILLAATKATTAELILVAVTKA